MTTVINNPGNNESTGGGLMIGIGLVLIILIGLFFVYGIPGTSSGGGNDAGASVNIDLPSGGGESGQ